MKNVNKLERVIILIPIICLLWGCSLEDRKKANPEHEKTDQAKYILNNSLSSNDHASYDGFVPKEGFIPTAEIAVQVAETILNEIYGREHIEKQKPFSVNLENAVWVIEGYLPSGMDGGVAYIEIRKSNGEILKVYHGK